MVRKTIRLVLILASFAAALAGVSAALAHDYVRILSQYQGANTVVVNYNVDHFQAGVPTRFNFRLYRIADGRPIDFDRVDVRFVRGSAVARTVALPMSADGDASYSHTFDGDGDHTLSVEFVRGPSRLATAEFPIPVEPRPSADGASDLGLVQWALGFGLGVVVTALAGTLGRRRPAVTTAPAGDRAPA
jgi:hypothetical protein